VVYGLYDASAGLDVLWTGSGSASAAYISLAENGYETTEADDGEHFIPQGSLDSNTAWEYLVVARWNEGPPVEAATGSWMRIETHQIVGPFSIF
jgi:hypothetical protein